MDAVIEEMGGFLPRQDDPEMCLDLQQYVYEPFYKEDVRITPVTTGDSVRIFAGVAGSVFSLPPKGIETFITSCLSVAEGRYFLLEFQDRPIGTIYVYVDENQHAGIYWVAIAQEYQRQGFGQALIKASLTYAQENGAHTVGLYSSKEGVGLYEKLGFKVSQQFQVYETV